MPETAHNLLAILDGLLIEVNAHIPLSDPYFDPSKPVGKKS